MSRIVIVGPYARSLMSFRGDLMKEWVSLGHDVLAMAPEEGFETELKTIGVKYYSIPMERAGLNPFRDLNLFFTLIRMFKQIKPDIVFLYAIKPVIYGSLAAWITSVPLKYSMITGLGFVFTGDTFKQQMLRKIINPLYRLVLKMNKAVIFQNPDDLAVFKLYGLVEGRKALLINGSGVEVTKYNYVEPITEPFSFLLIARLIWDKGIREYVEAARWLKKKYPQVIFKLLGPYDSNPRAIKETEINRWQDEGVIDYLGETTDVRPFLAKCSIYVLPSYREGTPRSVLEAMAAGRPVITTDTPGCRQTVSHGVNGFLVPVRNVDKLVEVMEYFILNPSTIKEMGLKSREIAVDKYDVKKVNRAILRAMCLEVK